MNLPVVEATPEVVGGWAACAASCDGHSARAGALTAALDNVGERGVMLVLAKLKIESGLDLVKFLAKK